MVARTDDLKIVSVKIADLVFQIVGDRSAGQLDTEPVWRSFITADPAAVTIRLHSVKVPPVVVERGEKIFDSQSVWGLYRTGEQHVIVFQSPVIRDRTYATAVFSSDFLRGDLYLNNQSPDGTDPCNSFFEYPISEIMMICLLARGRGIHVHASGISDDGRGLLFAGNSTHGKTTMARLWQGEGRILNDDRIVLRARDGRIWMYGTPWHGECDSVSSDGVPLDRVFFLRHAGTNGLRRVEGVQAAAMLLARSFPPLWDASGMACTLDFCDQVVSRVPCHELGFVPDQRVVDFIRCSA